MAYTYDFGSFDFETEDQGIFGSGAANVLEDSIFLGVDETNLGSVSIGGFVAGTGAKVSGSLDSLKLGVEAGYKIDPGSIDAEATYGNVEIDLPDNFFVNPGSSFDLAASSNLSDGTFDSTFPTIEATLDVIAAASGSLSYEAKAADEGISGGTSFSFDEKLPLVKTTLEKLEFFPEVDGLKLEVPLAKEKLSLKTDAATSSEFEFSSSRTGFKIGKINSPAKVELFNVEIEPIPDIEVEGKKDGDNIAGNGLDRILDFNIDLDGLLGLAANKIVPGSGAAVASLTGITYKVSDVVEVGYDIIDVKTGPTVSVKQDFTIDPELYVTFDFDKPVGITGVGSNQTRWSGVWSDVPEITFNETTQITPSFTIDSRLKSILEMVFGFELTVEALIAKGKIKAPKNWPLIGGSTLLDAKLGPVWELDPPLGSDDFGGFDIFNDEFDLGGWDSFQGDTIVVSTDTDINGGIDDGVNDAPEAEDDTVTTDEDTPLDLSDTSLFANDFDIDAYDTKTISTIDDSNTKGSVELLPSGDVSYDPTGEFDTLRPGETATDTFTYTLTDTDGLTDTATVTVTIEGVNDAPEAEDDEVTTDEDTALSFATSELLENDSDIEGDTLTVQSIDSSSTIGNVSLSNGTISYDPNGEFEFLAVNENTTDTFEYTINDGELTDTATVDVNVTGVNDVPVAEDDEFDIGEDMVLDGDVAENDSDVDASDVLTFSLISEPERGVLTFNDDGSFIYDADSDVFDVATPGDLFVESFIYEVNDGNGGVVQAEATLNVEILDDGEIIAGTNKPDELLGTDGGEDTITGGNGKDVIMGLDGADIIRGENGSDVLDGGESVDKLFGGQGSDELTGGDGADEFWFEKSGGFDTITDFEIGIDVMSISGLKATSFADLGISQKGSNAIVDFGGSKVTLENIEGNLLSADDFMFVSA
ncbi:MAG: Ig-like domain-containing protein [Cyanobacteria bacterium J06592_8]